MVAYVFLMRKAAKVAPLFFLACVMAISLAPAFASASGSTAPAIYFAESIFLGRPVTVSGVGFSPGATITFKCGDQVIQTVPSPLVADSSGAFTVLLMTGTLGAGICTLTATDGTNTAQVTLTVNEHIHMPRCGEVTRNSAYTLRCVILSGLDDGSACCAPG